MSAEVALTQADVDAVSHATADRVVERLRGEALPRGLLTTAEAARVLNTSEDFVRTRAAELGGIRLGGKQGALRFEMRRLREYMDRQRLELPTPARSRRRRGPRRLPDGVELLPRPED